MPEVSALQSLIFQELTNRTVLQDGVSPVPTIPPEDTLLVKNAEANGKEYDPMWIGDGLEITLETITIGEDSFPAKVMSATAVSNTDKVKTSGSDPTADYLVAKLKAGTGISISESTSPSYRAEISASGLTHPQVMSRAFLS